MQFIVIDKIYVEITNTRKHRFYVYFHLVSGDNVRVFGELSRLTLFLGLMKVFRCGTATLEKIIPSVF